MSRSEIDGTHLLTVCGVDYLGVRAGQEVAGAYAYDGGPLCGMDALDALDGAEAYVRAHSADYDDVEIALVDRRVVLGWDVARVEVRS